MTEGNRPGPAGWAALLVLPAFTAAIALGLGHAAGPFWLWPNLDPDYFYLFGALDTAMLRPTGLVNHPGITLQALGAAVLKAMHPTSGGDALAARVLADPEHHLRVLGGVLIVLNALGQVALGRVAYGALGSLAAAALLQTAPLMSSLILKTAFHVKPEPLLILAVLGLIGIAVAALAPGRLERHRLRFACAFGVVAGFAGATKVTALPVFLLPAIVLATPAAVGAYGAAAAIALGVFALPAVSSWPAIARWIADVMVAGGPHGHGAAVGVDWTQWAGEAFRMLRRPPMGIVFAIGVATLAHAVFRRRRGATAPGMDIRLLAATLSAQAAQALVVAKQPWGQYMIPAYMLTALAALTALRVLAALHPGIARARFAPAVLVVAVVAAGAVSGSVRLGREFRDIARDSRALDNARFASCARIYFYAASAPAFALYLADAVSAIDPQRTRRNAGFAGLLKTRTGSGEFWLDDWWEPGRFVLRDWSGARSMPEVAAAHPCILVRGESGRASAVAAFLAKTLPGRAFDRACSTKYEPVFTSGVGCDGRPR